MRRYDAYKDSGVKWMGEIPSHWEVKKLRTCFHERREKVSDKEFAPLSVSKLGITPQLETAVKTDNGDNRKKVAKGDFVVNSRSDRKGSCGFSDYDGSVSLINIVLTPRKINKLFYHYLFRSNNYIEEFYSQGRGIVADLWTTRYSEMRNICIPVPPLHEQQAIVDYLKDKTLKIEQYVSARERERELLDSLKQSEIANVVIKGLNPNVKMKDSGIPWIGEIPEHWEVKRLQSVASCNDNCLSEKTPQNQEIEYVEIGNVDNVNGIKATEKMLFGNAPSRARRITQTGDIIVSTVRTYLKAIAVIKRDGLIVSTGFAVIRPKNIDNKYIQYIMLSDCIINSIVANSYGVNYPAITANKLMKLSIPVPPLSEQQAIVAYIDSKLQKIDQYLADLQTEIDYLKEFKQRLISDVVTGQIRVAEPQKGEQQ